MNAFFIYFYLNFMNLMKMEMHQLCFFLGEFIYSHSYFSIFNPSQSHPSTNENGHRISLGSL